MLRTLVFVLAIGAPSLALADDFPQSPLHQEVRGHDGQVLGRIEAVERNENGDIVGVEIPGLEPGDAPHAPSDLVAEEERQYSRVNDRDGERVYASDTRTRLR